mgnify:CR=1 FL=1
MDAARYSSIAQQITDEIGTVIVGQTSLVRDALLCLLAEGHLLIEGVPGLGKTQLVTALAAVVGADWRRIQFTPDLMPADIVGTNVITEDHGGKRFEFQKGPIFANILLADEINRATPKTQSALLEAMSEGSVTVAKSTYRLEKPFFVLATQNPLESEGTYPLPEAQLDRFFFKLHVSFPGRDELNAILERTTGAETPSVRPVLNKERILQMQRLVREVPASKHVQDYVVRLLQATHPTEDDSLDAVKRFVKFGASPRGAQALILAAKIRALFDGRFAPSIEDVRACALPALRHRVLLNFEGEAEGVKTDEVLKAILKHLPESK